MGNKEFTKGNYEMAIHLWTKALELDPKNHILYSNRSGAYSKLNKF